LVASDLDVWGTAEDVVKPVEPVGERNNQVDDIIEDGLDAIQCPKQ
jgi:hypothetical protein